MVQLDTPCGMISLTKRADSQEHFELQRHSPEYMPAAVAGMIYPTTSHF